MLAHIFSFECSNPFLFCSALFTFSSMQSVESKKEEFQKYLEKAGVVDALTKGSQFSLSSYPVV